MGEACNLVDRLLSTQSIENGFPSPVLLEVDVLRTSDISLSYRMMRLVASRIAGFFAAVVAKGHDAACPLIFRKQNISNHSVIEFFLP